MNTYIYYNSHVETFYVVEASNWLEAECSFLTTGYKVWANSKEEGFKKMKGKKYKTNESYKNIFQVVR